MTLNDVLANAAANRTNQPIPAAIASLLPGLAPDPTLSAANSDDAPSPADLVKRQKLVGREISARTPQTDSSGEPVASTATSGTDDGSVPSEIALASMTKPSTPIPPEVRAVTGGNPNTNQDPTVPPQVQTALPASEAKTIVDLSALPVASPVKAKRTFMQKVEAAIPYIGAIGGGLEAAGNPMRPPEGAMMLQRAEENAIANHAKQRELDIQQQKANTEEGYRQAYSDLLKSRANENEMSPVTDDEAKILNIPAGTPMTYKEKSALFKQALTNTGGVEKVTKQNEGKMAVAQLQQGAPMTIDEKTAALAGQPQFANQALSGKTLANFYKALSARGISLHDLGNEGVWSVDRFGNRIGQVSVGSPSVDRAAAFAKARAQYSDRIAFDDNGQPRTISELEALQTGVPTESKLSGQQIFTGLPGLNIYKDSLQNIKQNLSVLNDTGQRALVAKTLRDIGTNHDPGIVSALINSAFQNGLTPQAASLVASTLRAREFIGSNRQFAGNLRGTEALYQRMAANVPGPQNSIAVNNALIDQDLAATDEIAGRLRGLGKPTKPAGNGSGATNTNSPSPSVQQLLKLYPPSRVPK